jgi:hypothetical protein
MKQFRSFYLIFVFLCVKLNAYAYDIAVENEYGVTIYYSFCSKKELEVVDQNQGNYLYARPASIYSGNVVIPEEVTYEGKTYTVIGIGAYAFHESTVTSVILPNTIINIAVNAFQNCNTLTSLTIPNSVFIIGECAFGGCSALKTVNFGDNVERIYREAFYNCTSLSSAIFKKVKYIDDDAFRNCSGLETIILGDSLLHIGESAFYGCSGFSSLVIPNSVTELGSQVFMECSNLESLTIGNGTLVSG